MVTGARETPEVAKWKSSDGKFGLVSATPSKVVLVKLDNHKQFDGTWLKMSLPMRREIASFWAEQDKLQLVEVQRAFANNQNQTKGIYDDLKAIHVRYPMSPYAGLALGVSYAGLMNEPDKAFYDSSPSCDSAGNTAWCKS